MEPFTDYHRTLSNFFYQPKYSDLTLKSGDDWEFKVHKVVVCSHSPYLEAICDGDCKESVEGVIELYGEVGSVVEAMLRFMYLFDYDDDTSRIPVTPMLFNACVYSIGNKYCIPALQRLALKKFDEAIHHGRWNADDFIGAIAEAYRGTPPSDRDLRDLVIQVAAQKIHFLANTSPFRQVVTDEPAFVFDFFEYMAECYAESSESAGQ